MKKQNSDCGSGICILRCRGDRPPLPQIGSQIEAARQLARRMLSHGERALAAGLSRLLKQTGRVCV